MGIVRVGVILGGNFPDGNCPGESYTGWKFSSVGVYRSELSGGNYPGGSFPNGSFHVTVFLQILHAGRLI